MNKTASFRLLTELETMYINKFKFSNLYYKKNASSLEGYKHTEAAKQKKMVERF